MAENDKDPSLRIDKRIKFLTEFRKYVLYWYRDRGCPEEEAELRRELNKMLIPARKAVVDAGALRLMTIGPNFPHPDFLSSSRKRLAPQLLYKGDILHEWKKKIAVALDSNFFDTLPQLEEVDKSEAEVAWLIYALCLASPRVILDTRSALYSGLG